MCVCTHVLGGAVHTPWHSGSMWTSLGLDSHSLVCLRQGLLSLAVFLVAARSFWACSCLHLPSPRRNAVDMCYHVQPYAVFGYEHTGLLACIASLCPLSRHCSPHSSRIQMAGSSCDLFPALKAAIEMSALKVSPNGCTRCVCVHMLPASDTHTSHVCLTNTYAYMSKWA